VRRAVIEHHNGVPSLDLCRRMLGVTPRTLHRWLAAEGTSFRAIIEAVHSQLARELIDSKRFSLQEVAYRLGCTDFANWCSPESASRASRAPAPARGRLRAWRVGRLRSTRVVRRSSARRTALLRATARA
jgi:methylphosphotriester-DNA--protein-cysteine methyltransferase